MKARMQILVREASKIRYKAQAAREGKSLGAWMREAAEEKLAAATMVQRLWTAEELRHFFEECAALDQPPEPDWEEHLRVIEKSRTRGLEVT